MVSGLAAGVWIGGAQHRVHFDLRGPAGGRLRIGLGLSALALAVLLAVPFEYRVGGNARVEGAIQRVLVAPVDGFLKQSLVRPGDLVKAGQVLAKLEALDVSATRDQARAGVAAAKANLEQGKAELIDAEANYRRTDDLFRKNFVSAAQLDTAKARLDQIGRAHV